MSQELVSRAIIKTLVYHDPFDYPLTKEEIYRWLISEQRVSRDSLYRVLATFSTSEVDGKTSEVGSPFTPEVDGDTSGVLREQEGYYFLRGREEIVEKRKRRGLVSAGKIKKAKRISWLARFVPWIRLVGLTGALAMDNCEEDDDIDWVIITAPHRLWISRACLVSLLLIFGQYRRLNKIKNKICPNVWLTLDNLKFPPDQRNLFLAHEIAQMKPLWSRGGTYEKFLEENGWVEKFLANYYRDQRAKIKDKRRRAQGKDLGRLPVVSRILDHLDDLVRKWQGRIMAKKVTTETIGEGVLKFHPQDVSAEVLAAYEDKLHDLGIT